MHRGTTIEIITYATYTVYTEPWYKNYFIFHFPSYNAENLYHKKFCYTKISRFMIILLILYTFLCFQVDDENTLDLEYCYTRNVSSATYTDRKTQDIVLSNMDENVTYGHTNQSTAASRTSEQDTSAINMDENMAYGHINQSTAVNRTSEQDTSAISMDENMAYGHMNQSTAANRTSEQDTSAISIDENIAYGHINQ